MWIRCGHDNKIILYGNIYKELGQGMIQPQALEQQTV